MCTMASQITDVSIVYSTASPCADQRKHQRSASLAFVRGSHRWPMNSPSQRTNNAENVSMWWRHHITLSIKCMLMIWRRMGSKHQQPRWRPSLFSEIFGTKWVKSGEGLPYIPRVHLSEGSLVRSPLKWLWSEEPMVRRSFIAKFLCSESCYVPKIPYSERPSTIWILCYEDSLVRSSSSPKGAMFRTSIFRKSPLSHTGSILRRSFSPKFPQF